MSYTIERIDRHPVEIPFREVPGRNLQRELPHWRYFEILEVELSDGSVGFGETMLYYTWGESDDEAVERALGANAASLLWEDSLGPGIQTACFDALGKALEVPAHELVGTQARESVPFSHWCIDMPAEDFVSEAEYARERGYTSMKVKGRPWFDLREQVDALTEAMGPEFALDIDFNESLLDADRALPLLRELEESPIVSHYEGPIPQEDVDGNRRLCRELETPVVLHLERPDPLTSIETHSLDGWILTGGADELRKEAAMAAVAKLPVWIQLVGSGVKTAMTVHFGATLDPATWPAITCHEIHEHALLSEPLPVEDGEIPVPDAPGLGVEVDRDALERYRIDRPEERPTPPRIIEASWPEGPVFYFAGESVDVMLEYAKTPGNEMPYFERGASARLVPDDGSDAWQDVYERAREEPVIVNEPGDAPL